MVDDDGSLVVQASFSGARDSPPVTLSPSGERELTRLVNDPWAVRVEHHWVLSKPDDRHDLVWRNRVRRAARTVIPPGFGRCDLVVPSFPRDAGYPVSAAAVVARCYSVPFGVGVGRFPGLDYFAGEPPYLSLEGSFPPMAGMKSAASWRRNHGIVADSLRTDITSALQTGNGRVPVFTVVHPPGWTTD